jgi:hypothetical protein
LIDEEVRSLICMSTKSTTVCREALQHKSNSVVTSQMRKVTGLAIVHHMRVRGNLTGLELRAMVQFPKSSN